MAMQTAPIYNAQGQVIGSQSWDPAQGGTPSYPTSPPSAPTPAPAPAPAPAPISASAPTIDYSWKPGDTVESYNKRIAEARGQTYTGAGALGTAPTTTPVISTSEPARTTFATNVSTVLPKMEAGITGAAPTTLTPQQIQQYYATEGKKTAPLSPLDWLKTQPTTPTTTQPTLPIRQQAIDYLKGLGYGSPDEKEIQGAITELQGTITIKSDNPAFQSRIDQANAIMKQIGEVKGEIQQKTNELNILQDEKTAAIAKARDAVDNKDAKGTNEALNAAKAADASMKIAFDALMVDLKAKQAEYITSLKPSERTTELKRELQKLRTDRQLLPLELRQEGISAAGIAGRQINDERVRAIQESNLLFELGLEQEAQQFKTLSLEKQMSFILDNANIAMKVQDRLDAKERQAVEDARTLRKDSLSALSSLVSAFEGLAWNDFDAQTQSDLLEKAKQFDIPISLLQSSLEVAKQQQIYNRTKKGTTESQEFTRVKQIVDMHPEEWGNAADQIDREFGVGTATKYGAYLKSVYQVEAKDEQKEIDAFLKDARSVRGDLAIKKIFWSDAWNRLHGMYPQASAELIDQTLGLEYRLRDEGS